MADPSMSPAGQSVDHRLPPEARERVRALLRDELARAHDDALARGVSPEAVAAALDVRIGRLKAMLDDMAAAESPVDPDR